MYALTACHQGTRLGECAEAQPSQTNQKPKAILHSLKMLLATACDLMPCPCLKFNKQLVPSMESACPDTRRRRGGDAQGANFGVTMLHSC